MRMVNKQLVNRDTNKCRNFLAQPIVLSDLPGAHNEKRRERGGA